MYQSENNINPSHSLSVAPMMGITDRNFRYLLRLISKKTMLYSEMVHSDAIYRGKKFGLIKFNPIEKPLVLQLGGNEPKSLSEAALIAEDLGYDEININIGCPSPNTTAGKFGLCLLEQPKIVADLLYELKNKISIPVSIKTRIGVNENSSFEFLYSFIENIIPTKINHIILHARIGLLNGIQAKDNLKIPPLNYDRVFEIKNAFPKLFITINGGLNDDNITDAMLNTIDGLMLGRAIATNPFILGRLADKILQENAAKDQDEVFLQYLDYAKKNQANESKLRLIKPLHAICHGKNNARKIRRAINNADLDSIDLV